MIIGRDGKKRTVNAAVKRKIALRSGRGGPSANGQKLRTGNESIKKGRWVNPAPFFPNEKTLKLVSDHPRSSERDIYKRFEVGDWLRIARENPTRRLYRPTF